MPRECNDKLQGSDVLEEVSGPTMHDVPIHFYKENQTADDVNWMADYFLLRFHHKGQFLKTKYQGGICTKIPNVMEVDKFSFSLIMEHVMEDCKYSKIGGLYVKKAGGQELQLKRKFVTIQGLQQEHAEKKQLENDSQQLVVEKSGPREEVAVVQENAQKKKPTDCMLVVEGEWHHATKKAAKKIKKKNAKGNAEKAIHSEKIEKVRKVKAVTKPSTRLTRSQTLNNIAATHEANVEEIVQPVHGDLGPLPPPPPLPTDLAQFKKLKREMDNDGVGTMGTYIALKKLSWNRKPHMSLMLKKKIWGKLMTLTIVGDTTKPKRCRGPSNMNHAFTRKLEDIPVITLNKKLQPVDESSKIRAELSSFMGTLARQCVPLDYINWSVVPESHKNSWWDLDVERLQNRPASIPFEKFKVLLEYWGDEDVQTKAVTSAGNRKKVTDVHNAGGTSFAKNGKDMVEGDAAETGGDSEVEEVQLDFDGHGQN
ncbi:hypothetical protein AgCh_008051 [Apium graveolens]